MVPVDSYGYYFDIIFKIQFIPFAVMNFFNLMQGVTSK